MKGITRLKYCIIYACFYKYAYIFFTVSLISASHNVFAQNYSSSGERLTDSIEYRIEALGNYSSHSGRTPFWLNANRYGLSGTTPANGHLREGMFRNYLADSLRKWKVGFGADFVEAHNYTSDFFVQQLYLDVGYKKILFSIGAKERPANFKNSELSSGSQTFGINARPIPEFRFEIPDYISISGKKKLLSVSGHFGYGFLTDGHWVELRVPDYSHYTTSVLYHSKSGFLKIGDKNIFPVTFELGAEMACTFGGKYYRGEDFKTNLYDGIGDFFDVIFGQNHDKGEESYQNAKGNSLGSWLLNLTYYGKGWKARVYYDHFFEDKSGMFYKYHGRDGMYGVEVELPRNRFVDDIVYEYLYTKYQSGALYHDKTDVIVDHMGAEDNYYNHGLYNGWEHWGMAIGNPLYLSPVYNRDNDITFASNRFTAHHLGISGNPSKDFRYRMLFSYSRQLGTYAKPYDEIKYQRSFLCELKWSPERVSKLNTKGWSLGAAFAIDRGSHTGNNKGLQFSLSKKGFFSL